MLFALFMLKSDVGDATLIFDIAAIAIICSIVAHGLTDTVGAQWPAASARPGQLSASVSAIWLKRFVC